MFKSWAQLHSSAGRPAVKRVFQKDTDHSGGDRPGWSQCGREGNPLLGSPSRVLRSHSPNPPAQPCASLGRRQAYEAAHAHAGRVAAEDQPLSWGGFGERLLFPRSWPGTPEDWTSSKGLRTSLRNRWGFCWSLINPEARVLNSVWQVPMAGIQSLWRRRGTRENEPVTRFLTGDSVREGGQAHNLVWCPRWGQKLPSGSTRVWALMTLRLTNCGLGGKSQPTVKFPSLHWGEDFPGGPVVRTLSVHSRCCGIDPWLGSWRSHTPRGAANTNLLHVPVVRIKLERAERAYKMPA